MKKHLTGTSFLFAAIVSFLLFTSADACICVDTYEGYPLCQAFWDSNVIFSGRVTELLPHSENPNNSMVTSSTEAVRFAVEKSYKGVEGKSVDVNVDVGYCNYSFEVGKEYFVYANRNPATGKVDHSLCQGHTHLLSEAAEDLAYIQTAASNAPKLNLYGSVWQLIDYKTYGRSFIGMSGIKIMIENDSKTTEVLTDRDGNYQLFGLKDGLYKVSAELPKDHKLGFNGNPRQVQITAPRCSGAVFVTKLR